MKFKSIDEVVAWRACVGCGACSYLSGGKAIRMHDFPTLGYRPIRTGAPLQCTEEELLAACPGAGTELPATQRSSGISEETITANGPTLEVWEGHAVDPALRYSGSSGGALSALAAYCLERGGSYGVLHVGSDPVEPLTNKTVLSRSIEELRSNTGSRYAPASVCDGLQMIENAPGSCVFIGQPSEVAALRKLQAIHPGLSGKVDVALSFFCAGSPPTEATLELIRKHGIDPAQVTKVSYRGKGWPGNFAVWINGESSPVLEMSYAESWAFLQHHRPWSVQIWPDGSGEHADITCGDPWYRKVEPGESGSSLVVARTEIGRHIIRAAMEAGYLSLRPLGQDELAASQRNLIGKKGAVWARLWTMRLLGIPTPHHVGYDLFKTWRWLPLREKIASFVGTAWRILLRGYRIPEQLKKSETFAAGSIGPVIPSSSSAAVLAAEAQRN
jgi:coenzyme F420 hydrogenase subunit beta